MKKVDSKIMSLVRHAIKDKQMIKNGDRVAIGLSGGKDSSVLAACLAEYQKYSSVKFDLIAVTIDMGFEALNLECNLDKLKEFVGELGIEYIIEKTNIADVVFNIRAEKNPCALCSKLRRGILNSVLIKKGFNKLALGHHADDLMETFLLSLLYEGRLSTFAPVSFMDKSGVTLIRPMIYVDETAVRAAASEMPVVFNPCPSNRCTKREDMKNLIKQFQSANAGARKNIFGAITTPSRNNLWED
ncbi:MAG: tRNA 2-thiocytidine biosynthesis TtcA family protein [Firmicutes bacterium]|nr:tRNA 2-thiocytidine biosynthesis TtcA family protein [Bacillota bacterium]